MPARLFLAEPFFQSALPIVLAIASTMALYGQSLYAGFMFDAPLDLPQASDRTVLQILTSGGASIYYRPVVLLIWHFCYVVVGHNSGVLLHAILLAVHAGNTWLVYQLGRKLLDTAGGVTAALLFAWFPLSYQTVGIVNSTYHALVTLFLLAAVLCYWNSRTAKNPTRSRLLLGMTVGFATFAAFTHETGLAALPLVAMTELALRLRGSVENRFPWPVTGTSDSLWERVKVRVASVEKPALVALPAVAYLVVWRAVPRYPTSWHWDPASIVANGVYFLQGLASPATSHLASVPSFGLSDQSVVLVVALPAVAALIAIAWRRRRLTTATFGLAWFAVTAFPSWLLLTWWNYVVDAPRLLYLPSAGISLLWAAALAPGLAALSKSRVGHVPPGPPPGHEKALTLPSPSAAGEGCLPVPGTDSPDRNAGGYRVPPTGYRLRAAAAASAAFLIGAILIDAAGFIVTRETMQSKGAAVVKQLVDSATATGALAGRTYIDLPQFLAPKSLSYRLGHTGVTMVPDYFGLDLVVYAVKHVQPPLNSLGYNDVARPWDYFYGFQGRTVSLGELEPAFRQGGGVYVTDFEPGQLQLRYVGQISGSTELGQDPEKARFGDWAVLRKANAIRQGNQLILDLLWQDLAPAPGDYTVFVQVTDGRQPVLAQDDGYPIGKMFPLSRWRPGDVIADRRYIPLPNAARRQQLRVLVGLYDRASPTVRAPARAADGTALPNQAFVVAVPST